MKVHLDCFPCFLRQSLIALRLGTDDEALQEAILKSTLEYIRDTDTSQPPAYTTTFIHRKIRQMLGKDPFREIKARYNRIALNLYPSMKTLIDKSPEPLCTAARLAIAGNIIDFGIFTSIDIEGTVDRALNTNLAVDDYATFKDAVADTDEILYLTDNAGEIVFDRLLIEHLSASGKKIRTAVKGSPVINDSTMFDAEESGLTKICEVIENGSDAVGTILPWTSSGFQKAFSDARLIISKGQGNFETLTGIDKNIFFLFQSKCNVVSNELGLPKRAMLLKKS
jgi:damage-control phosphatase, subfamily I